MSRKLPLADGETSRTACARVLVRREVDEKTGELLTGAAVVERVGWCADLVTGMVASLLGQHWNTADVDTLAGRGGSRRPYAADERVDGAAASRLDRQF
ncbi:hypothetical protein ACWGJ2_18645 [Streptomyces sp. NPDC054796]